MKVVILCGGQGSRIRDVSEVLPKPMLPIGGKPILWHIMKLYSRYGINDFILCLGYKGWLIKEFFLNYQAMTHDFTIRLGDHNAITFLNNNEEASWKVTLIDTGEATETGARLYKVRQHLAGEEQFCFTYGDGVADVNIEKLLQFHGASQRLATITGVRPPSRFGEMDLEGSLVLNFNEKPNTSEGWINGGFMVFNCERLWDYFEAKESLVLERHTIPRMVKDHQVSIYKHDGFWQCMDTLREYNLLNDLWNRNSAPWKIWE